MEHGGRHISTNRLKKERQTHNLTQRESSWLLDVYQPELSQWENGENQPNLSHALDAAVLYGLPVEQLFFEEYQASKKRIALQKQKLEELKKAGKSPSNDNRKDKKTNRSDSFKRK